MKRNIEKPDYSKYLEKAHAVDPHNGIIAMDDGRNGLSLYAKGLYEVAVKYNEARTIALTLFRSTSKEVLTDGSEGGQLLRQLEFEYAIRPFGVESEVPFDLWIEHQQFVTGISTVNRNAGKVYFETPHRRELNLPLTKSYLTIHTSDLLVSALKQSEDEIDEYVIRLWNVSEKEVKGAITFEKEVKLVQMVNLDEQHEQHEQPEEFLSVAQNQVFIKAKPKQIITMKVKFD